MNNKVVMLSWRLWKMDKVKWQTEKQDRSEFGLLLGLYPGCHSETIILGNNSETGYTDIFPRSSVKSHYYIIFWSFENYLLYYILFQNFIVFFFNRYRIHQKLLQNISYFVLISASIPYFVVLCNVYSNKALWHSPIPFHSEILRNQIVLNKFPGLIYLKLVMVPAPFLSLSSGVTLGWFWLG